MAFLTDFLTLIPPTKQKKAALASSEFKEWKELKNKCEMMLKRGYFSGDRDNLSDPEIRVLKQEERLLKTIWKKYHFIPEDMKYSALAEKEYGREALRQHYMGSRATALRSFCVCPQVKLQEIREAADKLSFMILPFEYLDVDKVAEIKYGPRHDLDAIESMISNMKEYNDQDLYVLAPVSLYNLLQVEQDVEQREVIFGGELMQTKAILDTIAQIQRNLFAILDGKEGDTGVWEIGQGGECSENELMHLRILVETIMPIQHSLLEIAQKSKEMEAWREKMQQNHCEEVATVLKEMSERLLWSQEAKQALLMSYARKIKEARDAEKAAWMIDEVVAMPCLMVFSLPHNTSLTYGKELARVIKCFGLDIPSSFYLHRGFVRQNNVEEVMNEVNDEIYLSF